MSWCAALSVAEDTCIFSPSTGASTIQSFDATLSTTRRVGMPPMSAVRRRGLAKMSGNAARAAFLRLPPAGTSGSRMDACRSVEVAGWLRWKPAHPVAIGRGKAEQAKRTKLSLLSQSVVGVPLTCGPTRCRSPGVVLRLSFNVSVFGRADPRPIPLTQPPPATGAAMAEQSAGPIRLSASCSRTLRSVLP